MNFAPFISALKGRVFRRRRITNHNVQQNALQGERAITGEHIQNNQSVRNMLGQRNIQPENLPREEDIKKLERRVKSEEKKLVEQSARLPKLEEK